MRYNLVYHGHNLQKERHPPMNMHNQPQQRLSAILGQVAVIVSVKSTSLGLMRTDKQARPSRTSPTRRAWYWQDAACRLSAAPRTG